MLEPAGTGDAAGTGHPLLRGGFGSARREGMAAGAWENQFLRDVQILLVPPPQHPPARGWGARGGSGRSLGVPVRSEGDGPSPNPPG